MKVVAMEIVTKVFKTYISSEVHLPKARDFDLSLTL